jgi:hypothetical protein
MPFQAGRERILADLESISGFGGVGPTAVTRLAFTPADRAAHNRVEALMRAEALETYYDPFGNLFGGRPGMEPNATPVMTESRLDNRPVHTPNIPPPRDLAAQDVPAGVLKRLGD